MSDPEEIRIPSETKVRKVTEREIVAGFRVVELEYKVHRPVYEDIKVERPIYTEKQVEVPVGIEKTFEEIGERIAKNITDKLILEMDRRLSEAIDKRIKEIQVPIIIYREEERIVEKPLFKDVEVERPRFLDKEIINPILKDVEIVNALVKNVEIERAVFKDRVVINPVFQDVEIKKPVFVEKEIVVIHPKYIDMKGNPEPEEMLRER